MKKLFLKIYLKINLSILNLRIYFVSNDLEFLEMSQLDFEAKKKKLDYLLSEASKTMFLIDILR
jgi:hypothetical protein